MTTFRVGCVVHVAILLGLFLAADPVWAASESQTFDNAASTASAGWAGYLNTPAHGMGTDLDFRLSNNAGGDPGEAGGWIPSRTIDHTYYADLTLADQPTQADVITASGRFVVPTIDATFDGGFDFGFFDSTNLVRVPAGGAVGGLYDFVGIRFLDNNQDKAHLRWWPLMGGIAGSTGTPLAAGVQYLFDLTYNPNGAGPGLGRLTADLRRADTSESLGPVSITYPSTGTPLKLNTFGLLTLDFNAYKPPAGVYIDNLQYGNQDAPVLAVMESQPFDSAASAAAAGWTGHLNTPADGLGVDLDYRNSMAAGGGFGEAGGALPSRTAEIAYYADTTLGGSLSEGDVLTATGRFTVDSVFATLDGGFELGFFNANDLTHNTTSPGHGGVAEAITIRFLDAPDPAQLRFAARADSFEAHSAGLLDVGTDYFFNLVYDPNGSGEDKGALTVDFRRTDDNALVGSATIPNIPSAGDQMDLNAFGLLSLDFDTMMPAAFVYIDDLLYSNVGAQPPMPGDANGDGKVDDADASALAANWLKIGGATWEQGDFNGDGNVNDLDASILAANWPSGGGAAVPEPTTTMMLVGGFLLLLLRRRRAS